MANPSRVIIGSAPVTIEDSVAYVIQPIYGFQSMGHIISIDLTGTLLSSSVATGEAPYATPEQISVQLFSDEQALVDYATEKGLITSATDLPYTRITTAITNIPSNPALYVACSANVSTTPPSYPGCLPIPVNEPPEVPRSYSISRTREPFYNNVSRYPMFLLITMLTPGEGVTPAHVLTDFQSIEYKVTTE